MTNPARDNFLVRLWHTPITFAIWCSTILIVAVVVWTLTMLVSLHELHQRFLDRFVVGASHGCIGLDFYSTPSGFRNLMSGSNIFLTEMDDYSPFASMFLTHPVVAVLIGPWTAPFSPDTAYWMFVGVSLVLLAASAAAIDCQFEGRVLRAFTLFALFCSLPTYLMLWNAQMHVLLVLAVALMLGGLVGLERDEQGSTRSLRMIQIGLLISLLSKPLALVTLPVFFATRETRRALVLPVAAYAAVSVLFLLSPALNPGGYNGIHWLNLLMASSTPRVTYSLVYPQELELVYNAEIYSLPAYLHRMTGAPVPQALLKLPLLAILALSGLLLFLASRQRRMHVLIATFILCLLSHFLCYYPVFEYHYTTLLPTLPVLWWMSQREQRRELRWLLWIAFGVLLANFLPTFYFLAPKAPMRYLAASTLLRVVPVVISFGSLLLYCIRNGWIAMQEGSRGVTLPRRQLPSLIGTSAALTLSFGAVLVSVLLSVPERLIKPLPTWDDDDWTTHAEDLLTYPAPGIKPAHLAAFHFMVGSKYIDTDPSVGLEHYATAIELASKDPDLLCKFGDALSQCGQTDLAISAYRRVLELDPDHRVAQERLRQLQDHSRGEVR
jgi:hypothetical protein